MSLGHLAGAGGGDVGGLGDGWHEPQAVDNVKDDKRSERTKMVAEILVEVVEAAIASEFGVCLCVCVVK